MENNYVPEIYVGENGNWFVNGYDTGTKAQGEVGSKGDKGADGAPGLSGEKGEQGPQGIQGPKGDTGAQGCKGISGIQGIRGLQGIPGPVNIANNLVTDMEGYALDARQGKILDSKLQAETFLSIDNYNSVITLGNLRGGKLTNIMGVKYGRVITLYVQINNITSGGTDATLLSFKNKKHWPLTYGVHNAYISKADNVCYVGQFSSNGNISWAIAGTGTISPSQKAMVLFTITYITAQ